MRTPNQIPPPPRHLRRGTAKWWKYVVTQWELEQHHVRLLTLAGQAWDTSQAARDTLRREGLIVTMPSGAKRPHPAVAIEADASTRFARLLRELDLDIEPPSEAKRPPALLSVRGGRHAS